MILANISKAKNACNNIAAITAKETVIPIMILFANIGLNSMLLYVRQSRAPRMIGAINSAITSTLNKQMYTTSSGTPVVLPRHKNTLATEITKPNKSETRL